MLDNNILGDCNHKPSHKHTKHNFVTLLALHHRQKNCPTSYHIAFSATQKWVTQVCDTDF